MLEFVMSDVNKVLNHIKKYDMLFPELKYNKINEVVNIPIIVSLTSYGSRVRNLSAVIESICRQTITPDRIILYLSDDYNIQLLSEKELLDNYSKLEIVKGVPNIKGHKKYLFSMINNPDAIIITVDDDCIYPKNTIQSLIEAYVRYPNCVISRRVHKMSFSHSGDIMPYVNWDYDWNFNHLKPSMQLFPTGCAGVLYPPHILPVSYSDIAAIKELSLNADDVWLKCFAVANGIETVSVCNLPYAYHIIEGTQASALYKINVKNSYDSGNDLTLKRCMNYFNLSSENFKNR